MVSKYFNPESTRFACVLHQARRCGGSGFRCLGIFFLQLWILAGVYAQSQDAVSNSIQELDLPQSARVVFVGNSLIEEAGKYGILEWMFTNAWPAKNLSFRNLGWSGDTAKGEARSYISQPPAPYDLLLQQIDTLKPALVVIGYGNVEAYEGEAGVEEFGNNLERLIRDIDQMGAQSILLSTIPQFPPLDLDIDLTERNDQLERYAQKIREVSSVHQKPFVDLFSGLKESGRKAYTDEGIHLNGAGYYEVGKRILSALGYAIPEWDLAIDTREQKVATSSAMEVGVKHISRTEIELELDSRAKPVLVDGKNRLTQNLVVQGLKKGVYAVSIEGEHILAASSSDLANGVVIRQGPAFDAAQEVQQLFAEINDLYFWEYRPLNRTYLVGFRRYEQGQNTYELGINSLFIDRLEQKIWQLKTNEPQSLHIVRIK